MASKLENLEVSCISLVKSGANKKSIIYKSANSNECNINHEIKIAKTSAEEGVVYGIVYSPDEIDTQGEYADAATIKAAAYGFMKSARTKQIDKEHDFVNVDAYVAESWIIKSGDPIFPHEKAGSWAVAIKLESDELKEAVKKGEISGLSMAGTANKQDLEQLAQKSGLIPAIIKSIEGIFTKQKGEEVQENQAVLKAIQSGFEASKKSIDELNAKLEALSAKVGEHDEAIKKSAQAVTTKSANDESEGVL